MDKQIEATRKAREANREFFRNLMQMRIEHTTQQPTINTLSPTSQLTHQSQQHANSATRSATTNNRIPQASPDSTMHDNDDTDNKTAPSPSQGDGRNCF